MNINIEYYKILLNLMCHICNSNSEPEIVRFIFNYWL